MHPINKLDFGAAAVLLTFAVGAFLLVAWPDLRGLSLTLMIIALLVSFGMVPAVRADEKNRSLNRTLSDAQKDQPTNVKENQ